MVRDETGYSLALWDMLRHLNLDSSATGHPQTVLNREGQQMHCPKPCGGGGAVQDPGAESATLRGWKR